jgi:hypothetical protein
MQPTPPPPSTEEYHDTGLETKRVIAFGARILSYLVYFYLLVVEVILGVGFILKLFGANPTSGFVEWWYRNLDRVMEPFRGIFTPIELGMTGGNDVQSIFETSVLFAMIVYLIVGIIISAAASWLSSRLNRLDADDRAYHARLAYERQAYLDRVSAEQVAAANAANLEAVARGASGGSTGQTPPPPPGGTAPPPA